MALEAEGNLLGHATNRGIRAAQVRIQALDCTRCEIMVVVASLCLILRVFEHGFQSSVKISMGARRLPSDHEREINEINADLNSG